MGQGFTRGSFSQEKVFRRTSRTGHRCLTSLTGLTRRTHIFEDSLPEVAANTLICLINQSSYLLGRQLQRLEQQFLAEGGFTERLYQARTQARKTK